MDAYSVLSRFQIAAASPLLVCGNMMEKYIKYMQGGGAQAPHALTCRLQHRTRISPQNSHFDIL